jgi:hypothetical protein
MQGLIRVLILGVLAAIVASLGSALFHLSRGGRGGEAEHSRKLAKALTVRIALSLGLFLLLMLAWRVGLISPHDLPQPPLPPPTR